MDLSRLEVFCEKGAIRNLTKFTGKLLCQSLFFNKVAGLRHKKETLAQFCEISKNTFFKRTPLVAASVFDVFIQFLRVHQYLLLLRGLKVLSHSATCKVTRTQSFYTRYRFRFTCDKSNSY